jgi:hypothetical protein
MALTGCKEDSTGAQRADRPVAALVIVSPDSQTAFSLGGGLEFSATARDARGNEIDGAAFAWTSTDERVAIVDDAGIVTARNAGFSWIIATLDAISDTAVVWVDPEMVLQNYCAGCHERGHAAIFVTLTCPACHSMILEWRDSGHGLVSNGHASAASGFDLQGAHALLSCGTCHDPVRGEPVYDPAGWQDCYTCHQDDYEARHAGSGFPPACLGCHGPEAWNPLGGDHAIMSGGFDLVGAHQALLCSACHDPVSWAPLFTPADDNDCIACHQADYDARHGGSGYPTTCVACHDTDSFSGATFNHEADFFPISTGKHQGEWNGCATCHTSLDDFSVFTCFNCHKHNQVEMDAKHDEISGYRYDSELCLTCHPSGVAP